MYYGIKEICQMILKESQSKNLKGGVQALGLYGMGGLRKSNAYKILCNELSMCYTKLYI